jgi:transcription antitermination factor NusG
MSGTNSVLYDNWYRREKLNEYDGVLEDGWYVIKSAEGHECKAVAYCYTLMQTKEFAKLKQVQEFKIPQDINGKPIIPGYVFIKVLLTPDIYYLLPKIPLMGYWVGIRVKKLTKKVLKTGNALGVNFPKPLSPDDISRLKSISELCDETDINAEIISRNLIPGAYYKLNAGAMKGMHCIFRLLDERNPYKAHVDVLIFRRTVSTVVYITDIGEKAVANFLD